MDKFFKNIDKYGDSFENSMFDIASGAETAQDAFRKMAESMLMDMARIAMKMYVMQPLMDSFKTALNSTSSSSSDGSSGWFNVLLAGAKTFFNAKGGAYSSASLSQYRNGIYDKPQAFMFANGGVPGSNVGVFAERGPEGILPLTRGSDGRLGVDAHGASGVTINVFNESNAQVEVQEKTSGADGRREIEIFVRQQVNSGIRSGAFDATLGSTYGLRRKGLA